MTSGQQLNYDRVAQAIEFISANFRQQPELAEIAAHVNMSPFHFQKLFSDWAGTSPKKFLQFISLNYAKEILKNQQASLADTAYYTGLSGTGRLHDLFVNIEGMTPAEFKKGGQSLHINYSFADSPFGKIIVASTEKGVCYMAFVTNQASELEKLKELFPGACYHFKKDKFQQDALAIFGGESSKLPEIKLHLKGSPFQLKVWAALLKIPMGALSTYGSIAESLGNKNASRAVGTAIGSNPVAFLIPCHRVIRASGITGGYMWGPARKTAMIGWEAAHCE